MLHLMKSVLVVDDEEIICRGVGNAVDPAASGCRLAGICRNGFEALEKIGNELVDILITDIRMPGLDGFALIKKAQALRPGLAVIVMSGYAEFEYAKQAMQYGVKNYILKPVSREELNAVLSETVEGIERERALAARNETLRRTNRELILRDFVLYGHTADIQSGWPAAEPAGMKQSYTLLVFSSIEQHYARLKSCLADSYAEGQILLFDRSGGKILILLGEAADADIREIYRQSTELCGHSFPAGFYTAAALADMPARYQEILRFLAGGAENGLTDLTEVQTEKKEYWPGISAAVREGDEAAVSAACRQMFLETGEYPLPALRELCAETVRRVADIFDDMDLQEEFLAGFSVESDASLPALIQDLTENFKKAARTIADQKNSRYSDPVKAAIAYIEENLHSPDLSLGYIAADITYLNKDYFGKRFKRETGVYFTQYVMNRRIQKAEELLLHTDMKIYNIAEAVGFDANAAYFTQVFKRYTGMAPQEYQKKRKN